jgi:hypothetical protein
MKRFRALVAVLALTAGGAHAKSCTDPTTHKFIKCPAVAPAAAPAPMMSKAPGQAAKTPPHCVKGKLCGMSCIKATDVCHKPS